MFFKNWPYWLKGGIILLIYPGSVILIENMLGGGLVASTKTGWEVIISGIAFFPIFVLLDFMANYMPIFQYTGDKGDLVIIYLSYIAGSFVVGSIIGLIYGKVKKLSNKI